MKETAIRFMKTTGFDIEGEFMDNEYRLPGDLFGKVWDDTFTLEELEAFHTAIGLFLESEDPGYMEDHVRTYFSDTLARSAAREPEAVPSLRRARKP